LKNWTEVKRKRKAEESSKRIPQPVFFTAYPFFCLKNWTEVKRKRKAEERVVRTKRSSEVKIEA